MRRIKLLILFLIFPSLLFSQSGKTQWIKVVTSEEEFYRVYEQMIDSARIFKKQAISVSIRGFFDTDTIFKIFNPFDNSFYKHFQPNPCCLRKIPYYEGRLSLNMPLDFYERLYDYLDSLYKTGDYYNMFASIEPLNVMKKACINYLESDKLSYNDSLRAYQLLQKVLIRIARDANDFYFLRDTNMDKYITDTIRKILIEKVKNPFYPDFYVNYYMSLIAPDTIAIIDTSGIPEEIKNEFPYYFHVIKFKKKYGDKLFKDYDIRLNRFYYLEDLGKEMGISPGKAYLWKKIKKYPYRGFLHLYPILHYAKMNNDTLLLRHLNEFKKKYPSYKW
jgi:hypothetical protein